ncbi:hypothetical protein [Nocardiopsis valliformis]|uniref:hypothetical protein n=1 Tax=Nocardiopsis valliformis TaxID=239974 RepID=UPI00034A7146|nr:hypothetical protein [Nocardiopsis valliformis]
MSRIPLPPGFNDFARELESHRRSLSPRPPALDRYPTFVRVCVVFFGLLVGWGAFHATELLAEQAVLAENGVVAQAEVVEVDHGAPVVRFTAADGTEVTAPAHGEHTADSSLSPNIVYLPDAPEQVALTEYRWPLWPWAIPFGLLLVGVLVVQHRGGVRAGWFRRRVRVLRWGPPGEGPAWRKSLPWTTAAAALLVTGAVLYALPLLGLGNGAVPLWLCGVGAALGVYGLALGVRALYLHAEHAPVHRAPRMFWPLPRWPVYLALVAGVLVPGALFFLFILFSPLLPDGERGHGTAEIVDYECVRSERTCSFRLTVEYEAEGLPYRGTVRVFERVVAEGLIREAEVPVSWDRSDPSDVRWEKR